MGRLGQKTGAGVYRYVPGDRNPHADPEVLALAKRLADERGIVQREIPDEEVLDRCILPLINIGAQILEEGLAYRASDIDVVWTSGYGFPRWRVGATFSTETTSACRKCLKRCGLIMPNLGHTGRHPPCWSGWRPRE